MPLQQPLTVSHRPIRRSYMPLIFCILLCAHLCSPCRIFFQFISQRLVKCAGRCERVDRQRARLARLNLRQRLPPRRVGLEERCPLVSVVLFLVVSLISLAIQRVARLHGRTRLLLLLLCTFLEALFTECYCGSDV